MMSSRSTAERGRARAGSHHGKVGYMCVPAGIVHPQIQVSMVSGGKYLHHQYIHNRHVPSKIPQSTQQVTDRPVSNHAILSGVIPVLHYVVVDRRLPQKVTLKVKRVHCHLLLTARGG